MDDPVARYAVLFARGIGVDGEHPSRRRRILAWYALHHWGVAMVAWYVAPGAYGLSFASMVLGLWLVSAVRYATVLRARENAMAEGLARAASMRGRWR